MSLYSVLTSATTSLADTLGAVDINGRPITVYAYDPGIPTDLPCVIVSIPDVERTSIMEGESQLGSNDATISWTTNVYLPVNDPHYANVTGVEILSDFIDAVDANYTLDGTVEDSRIERTDAGFLTLQDGKRLLEIQMTIRAVARY